MAHTLSAFPSANSRRPVLWIVLAVLAILLGFLAREALFAQVEGDRGIAPVVSSSDIAVGGIKIDVSAKTAEEARQEGWKQAMVQGWKKLNGPAMSDSQIESMVSSVVVEKEQIGPRRYIATLGVVFDRTRAGQYLGAGGPQAHSAPMLLIPVLYTGGTQTVYEVRNPWQRAWAEFQTGASAIDYVRPSGAGGDSLLLTYGQTSRRSRLWWSNILDQFSAADVLIAIARVERQWPGGPVTGRFTARYGPDNRYLGSFTLKADGDAGIPDMFQKALGRFDAIYTTALQDGVLRPDPTLKAQRIEVDPVLAALLDAGRRAQAADVAAAEAAAVTGATTAAAGSPAAPKAVSAYTVQFSSPDASSVDAALGSVRGTSGVQSASTSSIAIGGISVMRVGYAGSLAELASALRARGWQVVEGQNALSIRR
ncbi:MAG: heavy-metal-associated domain-containing protein [Novosphingobium sp.]|nr:heavy-metal-associated domain-containing protein [Novosphingobium sp.]